MNWHPVPSIVGRIAVLLTIIATAPAQAQQTDSARADSIRRVRTGAKSMADSAEKARADSLRRFELAAVVVTATRLSAVDERVPAAVEPLDLSTIPGPSGVPDALLRLPGGDLLQRSRRTSPAGDPDPGFHGLGDCGDATGNQRLLERRARQRGRCAGSELPPLARWRRWRTRRSYGARTCCLGATRSEARCSYKHAAGTERPFAEVEWGGGSFGRRTLTLSAGGKVGRVDGFVAATGLNDVGGVK